MWWIGPVASTTRLRQRCRSGPSQKVGDPLDLREPPGALDKMMKKPYWIIARP